MASSFLKSQQFTDRVKQELSVYAKLIPIVNHCQSQGILEHIISDYHHFMLHFNDIGNTPHHIDHIRIPDTIKLIWRIHLIHPFTYYNDCIRHFGRIIDPHREIFTFASFNTQHYKPLNTDHNHQSLKFTDIDLKHSLLNQAHIFWQSIISDIDYLHQDTNLHHTIDEFIQFMRLIGVQQITDRSPMIPSQRVDVIWHTLMLYPQIYQQESKRLANTFVIHDDFIPQTRMPQHIVNTRKEWNKMYGTGNRETSSQFSSLLSHTITALVVILCSILIYIGYNAYTPHNSTPHRRRLATADSTVSIAIIIGILTLIIILCVVIYYRVFRYLCQIEGCLVAVDEYQVYTHLSKSFPQGLKPCDPTSKNKENSNDSILLYSYMSSSENGNATLSFDPCMDLNRKRWMVSFKKHDNITVGVVYSVPTRVLYTGVDEQFETRMNRFCDALIDDVRTNSFNEYEEDYDESDDDNINEMPLYILSIRCKLIFVQLFTTFNRKYYWFKCKTMCHDPAKARREHDRKVQKALREDQMMDQREYKILFLGCGGSGKSTILNQLRRIHGPGFDHEFRLKFKVYIYAQVIEDMKRCIECMEFMDDTTADIELTDEGKAAAIEINGLSPTNVHMTASVARCIAVLWKEPRIRAVYDLRARTNVADSSAYFFDEMERISHHDYVPSDEDIVLARDRTTGILEQRFQVQNNPFLMVDVGGQRSERKKWIHCFDNVAAYIFVVSLSCYDQVLFEDESQNAMVEQIAVFEQIVNDRYLRNVECILFLNKTDLFEEKIKTVPITVCPAFEGFEGNPHNYDETAEYIMDIFRSKYKENADSWSYRQIYVHRICATNRNNIEKVFDDVQHCVVMASLQCAGLCGGYVPTISIPKVKIAIPKFKKKDKAVIPSVSPAAASMEVAEEIASPKADLDTICLDKIDAPTPPKPAAPAISGKRKKKSRRKKKEAVLEVYPEQKDMEIELAPTIVKDRAIEEEMEDDEEEEEEEEEEEREKEEEEEEQKIEELEEEIEKEIEFKRRAKKKRGNPLQEAIEKIKKSIAEWKAARKLIDNVFADLENMFYLLAQLLVMMDTAPLTKPTPSAMEMDLVADTTQQQQQQLVATAEYTLGEKCEIICVNLFKLCMTPFVYLLVVITAVFVILPSCFFLLIVRMNKVETTTKYVRIREIALIAETKWKRCMRVFNQLVRASFMFLFLVVYPIVIIYVIIPLCNYSDRAVIWSISSYLFVILLLQMFGTWRGVKSFEERKKLKPNEERYKPQKFVFNLGSVIAILLLFYEVFQLSIFAYQTGADSQQSAEAEEVTFSAESLTFVDSEKILQFTNFMVGVCYLSFDFLEHHRLEYYTFFSLLLVGVLVMFFVFRFVYELRVYGTLRWKQNNVKQAREIYFHSFVGTIIYGHGRLKHVNKWNAKIIALLADSFFLGICQKIILILSCDEHQWLRIEPERECWHNEHQLYSCIALILLGFYVPICSMIAPMFQEDIEFDEKETKETEEEKEEETNSKGCCGKKKKEEAVIESEAEASAFKQFVSFSNTIAYVAPYMSAFTVMECFMLIASEFVSKGGEYGAIVSQSIAMIGLLWFTVSWSFRDLNKYGLTQNEPVFPFGVSVMKIFAFVCGLIGCGLEILRYNKVIDVVLELFLLFVLIIVFAMVFAIVFLKYHSFFNPLDDDLDTQILVKFNKNEQSLKIMDLTPENEPKLRPLLSNKI